MKAIIYTQYDGPKQLSIQEVTKPSPKQNEVLIKVQAASINDWDLGLLYGDFVNRMMNGLTKPKRRIVGSDMKREVRNLENSSRKIQTEVVNELEERSTRLTQSLGDLNKMRSDENYNYKFGRPSFGQAQHNVIKGAGNNVIVQGSDDGLWVHEIRHLGQSLDNGGLRFSKEGKLLNVGRTEIEQDLMEIDAYKTQFSYDQRSFPAPGGQQI